METTGGLLSASSALLGLVAADRWWRRDASIGRLVLNATVASVVEHAAEAWCMRRNRVLTGWDRLSAGVLGLVLVVCRRGRVPLRGRLAFAGVVLLVCDSVALSHRTYDVLHSVWHVSIWSYVAALADL